MSKRLLAGFEGFHQTDDYEGYGAIGSGPSITPFGCWAHPRRKFGGALKVQRSSAKKRRSREARNALQGLAFTQKLYQIEHEIREKPPDEIHGIRD